MDCAVLTADIINSRKVSPDTWLSPLKTTLRQYGQTPIAWEIFRGDSFQLEVEPEKALLAAIHLKATIKQFQSLDLRIGIGLGEKSYRADQITESNGSAFQRSGACFDQLKKRTLGIKTGNKEIDEALNLIFSLACLTMDSWAVKTSLTVKTVIENPNKTQTELEQILHTKQSGISASLKRSGYEELTSMNLHYQKLISQL
ncbi:MAG: transcriptional regulator [Marinoscillum sp.]